MGLLEVDDVNHHIRIRLSALDLDWCQGRMPVPEGFITLRWQKTENKLRYSINAPAGYTWQVDNQTELELTREP